MLGVHNLHKAAVRQRAGKAGWGCLVESLVCLSDEFVLKPVGSECLWSFLSKGRRFPICTLGRITQYPWEDCVKQEVSGPRPADIIGINVSHSWESEENEDKERALEPGSLVTTEKVVSWVCWHYLWTPAGRPPGRQNSNSGGTREKSCHLLAVGATRLAKWWSPSTPLPFTFSSDFICPFYL